MTNQKIFVDITLPGGRTISIREIDGWWVVFDDGKEIEYYKADSYSGAYRFANEYIDKNEFYIRGAL